MNVPLRRDLEVLNRLLRPLVMAEASLLFGLGAAIGGYLGQRFSAALYLTGQTLVLAIVVAATSLTSFFTEGGRGLRPDHGERMEAGDGPSRIRLQWALYLGIVGLTVCATLGTVLLASGALGTVSVILLLAGILGAIAYSSPPFQLARSGYSELISTFLLAAGLPTFAYALLTDELHRLLLMSTTPIVAVMFAGNLALQLPSYGQDTRLGAGNLMARLGWRAGMRVHDVALLVGYLLLAIALALGLPRRVGLGSLMTLPLAVAQVWYLSQLRAGAPPRWWLLRLSSYGLVGLLTYLELSGYLLS